MPILLWSTVVIQLHTPVYVAGRRMGCASVVMRASALNMIMSGKSYREIGRELWLSPQTISGLKKALEEKIYRSYLERSKTERKKRVYSSKPDKLQPKHRGIPRRTKYGKIYI